MQGDAGTVLEAEDAADQGGVVEVRHFGDLCSLSPW